MPDNKIDFAIMEGRARFARKEHTCLWCGGTINPGEKYYCFQLRIEWRFMTERYHSECYDALERVNWERECNQEGYTPGSFRRGSTISNEDGRDWSK